MKNNLQMLVAGLCLASSFQLHAQGFVYDQQSATTPLVINYDTFDISRLLLLQSFVPTLSSIGFVELEVSDYADTSTSGATFSVALFSGSPQDPTLIGGTERVSLPSNFNNDGLVYSGLVTFYFAAPIALTPGQNYYFSMLEITGDNYWSVAVTDDTYPEGQLYGSGNPFTPPVDLWFREGITTVPEPSDLALWAIGGVLMVGFFKEMPPLAKPTANTIY